MDTPSLRVREAAEILNVSHWTVYRWVEEGKLEGETYESSLHQSRPLSTIIEQIRKNRSFLSLFNSRLPFSEGAPPEGP